MSIEQAIYDALVGAADVTAIVETRVYPSFVPQGETLPAVTYQCIDGEDEVTTDPGVGFREDRWQITCWAETHEACLGLFAAVQSLFERYAGIVAGVTIHETFIERRRDVPSLSDKDERWKGYGKMLEIVFSYTE